MPISLDRLCIGLYIKLQYSWVSHPFPLNEFRISSQRDIDLIRKNRLTKLLYDPDRSDELPSEHAEETAAVAPVAEAAVAAVAEPAAAEAGTAESAEDGPGIEEATAADDPARLKAASLARAARQRAQLGSLSQEFMEDAHEFTRGSDLLNAGEAAGFKLIEGLVEKRIAAAAKQDAAMLYCGGAFSHGGAASDAADSLSACVLALTVGRKLNLDATGQHVAALGAALCSIGLQRLQPSQRHESDSSATRNGGPLRDYPAVGAALLARLGTVPQPVVDIVAQHRECLDGTGFPRGLAGDAIRLDARLVGAIRVYTVLTSEFRLPRALSPAEAVRELFMQYRSRQGADVVESFLTTTTVYPPGTFVELSDGSLAFVLGVNPRQRLLPRVLLLDNPESPTEGNIVDLAEIGDTSVRRALSPDSLPPVGRNLQEASRVRGLAIGTTFAAAEAAEAEGLRTPDA